MSVFAFAFVLGLVGLAAMAALGLHSHGDHGAGTGAGHGHAHDAGGGYPGHDAGGGHGAHAANGHAGDAHASHGAHDAAGAHHGHEAARALLGLLSPRVLFSLAFGFGAAGLLARALAQPLRVAVAIAGGLLFEFAIVRPLWRSLFGFASRPALTLDACVMDTATVVSAFDKDGFGMVSVDLQGMLVQVLARLDAKERNGARLVAGDRVRIEAVDSTRNRVTVSRLSR
ncbi:MAG TPA: hypothetical protein VGD77_16845 [Gemmatimonadaceae bacterium]